MRNTVTIMAATVMLIAGCSPKKPPECFTPETTTLLRQIIAGMVDIKSYPMANIESMGTMITINSPAPTAYDAEIQRYTCQAQISVPDSMPVHESITPETDKDTVMMIIEAGAKALSDGSICGPSCSSVIEFTSQLANKEHIVSVNGVPGGILRALGLSSHITAANAVARPKLEELKRAIAANPNPAMTATAAVSEGMHVPSSGLKISAEGSRGGVKTLINESGERLYARAMAIDPPAVFTDDGKCGEKVVSEILVLGEVQGIDGEHVKFNGTVICDAAAGYLITDPSQ